MSNKSTDIETIVAKAKVVGLDEAPKSTSVLEDVIYKTLTQSGKVFSAKLLHASTGLLTPKHFSDKMWQMSQKGIITKCDTRGYYCANKVDE